MGFHQLLRERGRGISDYYAGGPEYFALTPSSLTLLQELRPLVAYYCRGRVLDAGAGRGVYRQLLEPHASSYFGVDVSARSPVSVVGDIQNLPFAAESLDTVFCSQVLEHVPEPVTALAEFRRVLSPGGHVILSVPHISWLHNEPNDYFRFTLHGLRFLLETQGFAVVAIRPAGGLLSLLGHIGSTLFLNLLSPVPGLRRVVRFLNELWGRAIAGLDRILDRRKIFALNYACVARKKVDAGVTEAAAFDLGGDT